MNRVNENELQALIRDMTSPLPDVQEEAHYRMLLFVEYHNPIIKMDSYILHENGLPQSLLNYSPTPEEYSQIYAVLRECVASHNSSTSALFIFGKADAPAIPIFLQTVLEIPLSQREWYQALIALENHLYSMPLLSSDIRQLFGQVGTYLERFTFLDEETERHRKIFLELVEGHRHTFSDI